MLSLFALLACKLTSEVTPNPTLHPYVLFQQQQLSAIADIVSCALCPAVLSKHNINCTGNNLFTFVLIVRKCPKINSQTDVFSISISYSFNPLPTLSFFTYVSLAASPGSSLSFSTLFLLPVKN